MSRKPTALALLILLIAGGFAWPAGQRVDVFAPVDALVTEKRYSEAIDMLRGLLITSPSKTAAIKDRIAKTLLLQADQAIKEQRYNDAIATLSLFWAQYPERADQAQSRMREINKVHEKYNKKAKELLAYMSDAKNRVDPDYNVNVAKKLKELEDLDRNNPDAKKTITSLKETSLALVNQDAMKKVMSAARSSIDSGQYVRATRDYLKGFELFKPEFDNADYDAITTQAIAKLASQAKALPDAYEGLQSGLEAAVSALAEAFRSGSGERAAAALPAAQAALDDLGSLRQAAFAIGGSLSKSYDAIPKEGKSPIEYQYLAYLDIFIRGRPDAFDEVKKPTDEKGLAEGIGGAMLAQTEAVLKRLQLAAEDSLDAAYAAGEKSFDAGAYREAAAAFAGARALVAPGAAVLARWSDIPEGDFVPELAALRAEIAKAPAVAGRLAQLGELADASARLSSLALASSAAAADSAAYVAALDKGFEGSAAAQVALKDARAAMDAYRQAVAKSEADIAAEASAETSLRASSEAAAKAIGDERPNVAFAAYSKRLDKAASDAVVAEYAIAAARGGIEAAYIDRELAARKAAIDSAEVLVEGALSTRPERAAAGYRDPSATQSVLALQSEAARLASLEAWIGSDLASMGKEGAALVADQAFAAARARIEAQGAAAKELEARRAAALAKATERRDAAVSALAAARKDIAEAQAKLDEAKSLIAKDKGKGARFSTIRKDFSDARARLDRGLGEIVEASTADFDAKAWTDYQKLYASIDEDLSQTKKDYIVSETFRLLAEGQTYYEQALFDLSGESLATAQELWREENDSDQEQVKYWQNLVRQASDTNNKREVKQSDALYYEIGSYLSEARMLYLKGESLAKAGKVKEAAASLEAAQQNLSFVTRAFPLNAEAGLLTLQILKTTDPDAYKKSLPRRVQEALDLLATDASSGYSRIADLYKMEPSYPGLKAALEKAEIKVGKRRAPPSKEDLASAAAFVSDAEKLLKSGRKDDAAKAEASLNSALRYDPTNKRALALLRDLKTLQGKTAGPALGLADKAILDQATRAFAARQYNNARDTLSQLLSDPNKRTREVLKLDNDLKTLGYN
jgi:hypothetical protein